MDWESHKKHRRYVADTAGEWWGLADRNGVPVIDLPPALPNYEIPVARNSLSAARANFLVQSRRGLTHRAVGKLIDPGIGRTDGVGRLQPKLRGSFFLVHQRGDDRKTFQISSADLDGGIISPTTMELKAADMLTVVDGLKFWSYPRSLRGRWQEVDRDFATEWTKTRTLQNIFFAAQADGFVLSGPAEETIREGIAETLEATWRGIGRTDHPVVVSAQTSGLESPNVMIRPDDGFIWQTIAPIASMAGVVVKAMMWWPGDLPVPGHTLTKPTIVITVLQSKEV